MEQADATDDAIGAARSAVHLHLTVRTCGLPRSITLADGGAPRRLGVAAPTHGARDRL